MPKCNVKLNVKSSNEGKEIEEDKEGQVRRRCQIKVQFESGAKIKFLAALFQPMTSISDLPIVKF